MARPVVPSRLLQVISNSDNQNTINAMILPIPIGRKKKRSINAALLDNIASLLGVSGCQEQLRVCQLIQGSKKFL